MVRSVEQSPFLTIQEFADLLRVEYHTVWARVKSGEIPSIKFGRAVRIHRDVLKLMVQGQFPSDGRFSGSHRTPAQLKQKAAREAAQRQREYMAAATGIDEDEDEGI